MAKRLIEALTGIGDIYSGDLLLRAGATYQLTRWSEDGGAPGTGDGSSGESIDGTVAIGGIAEAVVLAGPEALTLKLQDGRRLAFSLTSTGGQIVGRGGLQPA